MDYEQRFRRLDTEENTELSDLRARVNMVDREIERAMHEVRRFQNAIVRLTLKKAGMREEEYAIQGKFKYRRDELHKQEKMELRQRQATVWESGNMVLPETSVVGGRTLRGGLLLFPLHVLPRPGQVTRRPASVLWLFHANGHRYPRIKQVSSSTLLRCVQDTRTPPTAVRFPKNLRRCDAGTQGVAAEIVNVNTGDLLCP